MSQPLSKKLQAFTPPEEMLLLIPTRRICWRLSFHRLFCYGGQHWAARTRAALLCKTFKSNKMGSARTLADWPSAAGLEVLESDVETPTTEANPWAFPHPLDWSFPLATVQLSNIHIIKHVWQKCRITYHNWSFLSIWRIHKTYLQTLALLHFCSLFFDVADCFVFLVFCLKP